MAAWFGRIADQAVVCGCHVHVGVDSREAGVAIIDRIRPWLATLLALSANSPLWQGEDTGFDSWRTQVWSRWPTAGPTSRFGDLSTYEARSDALIGAEAALDRAGLYYEARLSEQWPTVEVRVADVCLDVDVAVLLGVLVRALVTTAARATDTPVAGDTVEMLRAATFMSSRWGLRGNLVDPLSRRAEPARSVASRLLSHTRDALADSGDLELATQGVEQLLRRGTAAARQREVWLARGPSAVIDLVTVRGG
jgi:carboxylate-amine ligase